jgi:YidC/Oxa1 family membrane protein insertase
LQNILGIIIVPLEVGIVWLALTVGNAGIGIILFTMVVRLVLSPLQIKQLRNAKAMQRVQPLMNELRQKHGKDRLKMNEEMQKLYREHGINPLAGCAPMLLQMPILFGLFYAFSHLGSSPPHYPHPDWVNVTCNGLAVHNWPAWFQHCYAIKNMPGNAQHVFNLFHAKFLWLSNGLGEPDPLYILPILAGITQWIQSRMMLTRSTDPQQQMMNTMMNFMPLMIVFFATRYASGLSLYWVTSTVIAILIQLRITGWGLLPVLGNKNPPSGGKNPPPTKPVRPVPSGNGSGGKSAGAKGSGDGKRAGATPVTQTDENGEEPAATGTNGRVPVARQRKKANRARGGRGGGRRG